MAATQRVQSLISGQAQDSEGLARLNAALSTGKVSPSPQRQNSDLFIFDIDGVLTHPGEAKVSEPILDQLVHLYKSGARISFNTGRPASWTIDTVLLPLAEKLGSTDYFNGTTLAAENGAAMLSVQNGKAVLDVNSEYSVSERSKVRLQTYADRNGFLSHLPENERADFEGGLVFDTTKSAMGTLFIPDTFPAEKRARLIAHLATDVGEKVLRDLEDLCDTEGFRAVKTTIAFDVQHKSANKKLGTEEILVRQAEGRIEKVYIFGDSPSDYEMTEVFAQTPHEYFHVGPKALADGASAITSHVFFVTATLEHIQRISEACYPSTRLPTSLDRVDTPILSILALPADTEFQTTPISHPIPGTMSQAEQEKYLAALKGERDFLVKRGAQLPEISEEAKLQDAHSIFVKRSAGKLGLRNLQIASDTNGVVSISGNHCVVPHPAYTQFNLASNHPSLRDFGSNLGVAATLVTKDGLLVLQHRKAYGIAEDGKPSGNKVYGDIPGAAVAGLLDAPRENSGEKSLNPIALGKKHLGDEGKEEIGESTEGARVIFTGIMTDKLAQHHELSFTIQSELTADEIVQGALKNTHKDTAIAFRENLIFIPATPEAIEKLLCEVRSPLPPTHAGPYLLCGYNLVKESKGDFAAHRWMERVKNGMMSNYAAIDAISIEATGAVYNPNSNATNQGISNVKEEFERIFGADVRYVEYAFKVGN